MAHKTRRARAGWGIYPRQSPSFPKLKATGRIGEVGEGERRKPRKDSLMVSGPDNHREQGRISRLVPGLGVKGRIRINGPEVEILVED